MFPKLVPPPKKNDGTTVQPCFLSPTKKDVTVLPLQNIHFNILTDYFSHLFTAIIYTADFTDSGMLQAAFLILLLWHPFLSTGFLSELTGLPSESTALLSLLL